MFARSLCIHCIFCLHSLSSDTFILAVTNFFTCILAGLVVFAYLGNLHVESGLPIEKVAQGGSGLIYVIYPYAVTKLPVSPLFAIMFFLMMLSLGMGTMMASVETLTASMEDLFPVLKSTGKIKALNLGLVCLAFLLIGLLLCTQAGQYWIEILDTYAGGWALFLIGFFECMSVAWIYGAERIEKDFSAMFSSHGLRTKITFVWLKICWLIITPGILLAITIFYWAFELKPIDGFPHWTMIMGELLAASSVIGVVAWMVYEIYKNYSNGQVVSLVFALVNQNISRRHLD